MAFGRLGNTNTFLQTVETRLIQADLSACSGNSGGGLVNAQGDIVEIMHAIIQTEKEETQAHCSRMTLVKDGTKWRMAVKDVADLTKEAGIQKHDLLLMVKDTEELDAAQLKNYLIERTTQASEWPSRCGGSMRV